MFRYSVVVLCHLLIPSIARAGEFDWKLSAESGYFHARARPNLHSLSALQTAIGYAHGGANRSWSVQMRVRPEWFDTENQMLSGSINAWFRQKWSDWQIRGIAGAREQWYRLDQSDLQIHTLQVHAIGTFQRWKNFWPEAEGRIVRTESKADARNVISANAVFFRSRYFYSDRGSWSGGVFTERFQARTNDIFTVPSSNRGWRNGVELRMDYTRSLTINFQYLISWRTSQWTRGRSLEQEINAAIGRAFAGRWSVFLLAEYYLRHIGRNNQIARNLLYTNSNYDNRLLIKLGFDVTSSQSIFLKAAYLRNELIQEKTRLSGGHLAMGYEVRK